jgi:DNA-directed RNA polymerase specialized sigma24 family protein
MLHVYSQADDPVRQSALASRAKERAFLDHYSWLFSCALNMTHGQRERAEDLVQDTCVEFLVKSRDLESIGELRGYLNGNLRNLHLLQLRRASRHPGQDLSILDQDSILVGLRTSNVSDELQQLDLLERACGFVCYRKEAARTASILILRFFHGYYPAEICHLLHVRRAAVDLWILRGRTEAKQYLKTPYALPAPPRKTERAAFADGSQDNFLRYLRLRIFDSCVSTCPDDDQAVAVTDVQRLAHLVSCESCLEKRSDRLGLDDASERMSDEIVERDGGPSGRDRSTPHNRAFGVLRGRGGNRADRLLRRIRSRQRDLFEHRPRELSVVFDGQPHAALQLNAAVNQLHLRLDRRNVPACVGILSERDVRMLLLDADDLDCTEPRRYAVALSEDRRLEVAVDRGASGPEITIIYRDSALAAPALDFSRYAAEELRGDEAESLCETQDAGGLMTSDPRPSFWPALWRKAKSFAFPGMDPLLTTAIVLSLTGVLCFLLWLGEAQRISPNALLDHAASWDAASPQSAQPGVIAQTVRIRSPRGALERTIYRDARRRRTAKARRLSLPESSLKAALAAAGVDWDEPLSASAYSRWRGRQSSPRETVRMVGGQLLVLTTIAPSGEAIASESLTVRAGDFHPVRRTLELRDAGRIEIAELSYSVSPWSAANESYFEPEPGSPASAAARPVTVLRLPLLPSEAQLDEAELSVRIALNDLRDREGQQLAVTRTPRSVEVDGLVEDEDSKRRLRDRLATLPNVTTSIRTFEEMDRLSMHGATPAGSITAVSEVAAPSLLETYLLRRGETPDQVRRTSEQLLEAALAIDRDSKELAYLLDRFRSGRALTAVADGELEQLLSRHRASLEAELAQQEQVLADAGLLETPGETEPPNTRDEGGLAEAAERNLALCQRLASTGTPQTQDDPAAFSTVLRQLAQAMSDLRARLSRLAR